MFQIFRIRSRVQSQFAGGDSHERVALCYEVNWSAELPISECGLLARPRALDHLTFSLPRGGTGTTAGPRLLYRIDYRFAGQR